MRRFQLKYQERYGDRRDGAKLSIWPWLADPENNDPEVANASPIACFHSVLPSPGHLLRLPPFLYFRFTLLKKTLDEVMRSYPQLTAPGSGATSVGGGASGADSARLTEEVSYNFNSGSGVSHCRCCFD